MKKILIILCLISTFIHLFALEVGDAVYRQGDLINIHGHAGVYAGDGMVYQMGGISSPNVALVTFDTFLDGKAGEVIIIL